MHTPRLTPLHPAPSPGSGSTLYAVDGSAGTLLWTYPLPNGAVILAPPAIGNGTLIVAANSGDPATATYGQVFKVEQQPAPAAVPQASGGDAGAGEL